MFYYTYVHSMVCYLRVRYSRIHSISLKSLFSAICRMLDEIIEWLESNLNSFSEYLNYNAFSKIPVFLQDYSSILLWKLISFSERKNVFPMPSTLFCLQILTKKQLRQKVAECDLHFRGQLFLGYYFTLDLINLCVKVDHSENFAPFSFKHLKYHMNISSKLQLAKFSIFESFDYLGFVFRNSRYFSMILAWCPWFDATLSSVRMKFWNEFTINQNRRLFE